MRAATAIVAATVALASPAAASAQEPCPQPRVTEFEVPGQSIRAGREVQIRVIGADIARVDVTRGPLRAARTTLRGRFATPGRTQIQVVAVSACGARSGPATLRLTVRRPCAQETGRTGFEEQCDVARGSVRVLASGLATQATWLDGPCRDTGPPHPDTVPVARAASCVLPLDPYAVNAKLPVVAGRRVTIVLGMRARRVNVRLGDGRRGPLLKAIRARRLDRTGRRWRVRLPTSLSPAFDRLFIGTERASGNAFLVGISARAAS